MLNYIIRRSAYGVLVLAGVVVVVFLLFNVLPGDPARMTMGQRADVASLKAINKELGRDKPLFTQFFMYLNDLSPISLHETQDEDNFMFLDSTKYDYTKIIDVSANKTLVLKIPYLRRSYQTKRKVTEIITDALPGTAILALSAMIFATIMGIILGVISALKQHSMADNSSMVVSILGMSTPSFFSGILIAWIFGYLWSDYTGLNMTGSLYTIDPFKGEMLTLKNLILPAFTLGIRPLAIIVQLTRSSMLDILSQDYIRTATAKGLSYYKVIVKHALKNALNPVLTAISGWFASLLGGAFFVEYIFSWKGVGKLTIDALDKYDFPIVMGTVLFIAVIFVVINIIMDCLYSFLDPRITFD
ncbi:MAG: ABC transporter permease [Bacteroidetes bacterium]|nr:ABC transporter permease [Bacteroidia bacterium]MBL4715490.1 ABC transporter permease [Bacteroidia bacterium]PCH68518.1 MAG: ABC transporter permease [Bacteroidota bacterium]